MLSENSRPLLAKDIPVSLLKEIVRLRKTLHRYPELSGQERQTAGWVRAFLEKNQADQIIAPLGGNGLAAIYDSGLPGPCLLLRADLDALPIQEVNDFEHKSTHEEVSHKCGHDGHTAILCGVGALLARQKPSKGKVVLLFQPEEETGQGAARILRDQAFAAIKPDRVFALHNLPGFPKKTLVLRDGPFAAASRGMIIQLKGESSHAAQPHLGKSPGPMLPGLIDGLLALPGKKPPISDYSLVTIIHVKLGEQAFGTNPGKGVVMATLRSFLNEDMNILVTEAEKLVHTLAKKHGIEAKISYTEVFPATMNTPGANEWIRKSAKSLQLDILSPDQAFSWSEDFGHFTSAFPGALFGMGAGTRHPSLHNHDYDFPDEIIPEAMALFYDICLQTAEA